MGEGIGESSSARRVNSPSQMRHHLGALHFDIARRENSTHTVAIPLHLANVFNATLSPNSKDLAFPFTTATLVLVFEGRGEPSGRSQSTLGGQDLLMSKRNDGEGHRDEEISYEQSTYLKISSKNGTPASTPYIKD